MNWLWMGIGGVLGVISRYLFGGLVHRFTGLGFPYGTFVVNLTGCLLIGFFSAMGKGQWFISPNQRAFLFIGFLGAYTTFSTYMLEGYELLNRGMWIWGGVYLLGSVLLGMGGFLAGVLLARLFSV